MKRYLAYIRVSTVKQGERGVSLQEQREAIIRYAQRNTLNIVEWFEERETAAKYGRPLFAKLLKQLKQGQADGVIIHKIDRSARNLRDWADLGQLIDSGVEVHFSQESLDLNTRGGRLSADIQAVVAADFIRNLREETLKGLVGRLKQGLYPFRAPIGYLDQGKAMPKIPDPAAAPLIRRAFTLYATGAHNLVALGSELERLGLRNRSGGTVSKNGLSTILNNPFYAGIMRIERTGHTYPGVHEPLITVRLFRDVQAVLQGRFNKRTRRHNHLFRRLLRCKRCEHFLTGELQKGHVYYRCHTRHCAAQAAREDEIERLVLEKLSAIRLHPDELIQLKPLIERLRVNSAAERVATERALALRIAEVKDRLNRLTDAYIDRLIDKDIFEARRQELLLTQVGLEHEHKEIMGKSTSIADQLDRIFELAKVVDLSYRLGNHDEKRELMKIAISNFCVDGKNVAVELHNPFLELANRVSVPAGDPYRDRFRTGVESLFDSILKHVKGEAPGGIEA